MFKLSKYFKPSIGIALASSLLYIGSSIHQKKQKHLLVPSSVVENVERCPKSVPIEFGSTELEDSSIPIYNPTHSSTNRKQHLVILGTGWGSVGVLQSLDRDAYHVTIISPTNYFLFTPLLPSAAVGTVETNSLTESIRTILKRFGYQNSTSGATSSYLEASAIDLENTGNQTYVKCETLDGKEFLVRYDKLVIAVGARSVTFGVPGVESYCNFLKTVHDVKKIKEQIVMNLEKASLPTVTDQERKHLLSFVICGGGPTGVEFAAELFDLMEQDISKFFPSINPKDIKVSIIQSSDHILNTYDLKISTMAEENFKRSGIDVITKSRVTGVYPNRIEYTDKNGKQMSLHYGLCVWTTGIGMQPFVENIARKLEHNHLRALIVDDYLKVKGLDNAFAIGDCSTVDTPKLVEKLMEIFSVADVDQSGTLSYSEFMSISDLLSQKYPQTAVYLRKAKELFQKHDADKDSSLNFVEFENLLKDLDRKLRPLPATAQVAQQQGHYVGKYLNWCYEKEKASVDAIQLLNDSYDILDNFDRFVPFRYHHLGSLAYLGSDVAAIDFGQGWVIGGYLLTYWLWKSVYLSEQISLRQRVELAIDWFRTSIFGRDITKS